MRRSLAVLAVLATALAGCGGGEDSEDSDQAEITAVLQKLFDAQQSGDAETACEEVYVIQEPPRPGSEGESGEAEGEAEAEAEHAEAEEAEAEEGAEEGAGACERAFERAAGLSSEVDELSTDVQSIAVDGDRATATVHTELQRSDGSTLSQDAPYDLVRTDDGWRIRISEEG